MRLIVTGGGTGGHLFPAIAVAVELKSREGAEVLFIGTARQIDNRALAGLDFEREIIAFSGIKGLGIGGTLRAVARLLPAVVRSLGIIRRFRPDLVFGVGGYVTGPVLLAAKLMRIPICIHEQNSVPGLANRLAGRLADRICISLPCTPPFPEHKTVLTGNPVRKEILKTAFTREYRPTREPVLLILGGSQGAHRVNELVVDAAGVLKARGIFFRIIHQTGSRDEEMVDKAYRDREIEAEVKDFFSDMADLYSRADLVISRAGATTLAELAVMGLPAVLIPYPHAADDHQTTNAAWYVDGGGALSVQESELDGEQLAALLIELLKDEKRRAGMSRAMKERGRPEATARILEVCTRLAA